MIDPQVAGKVRQKLCSTLDRAEECASKAAETISVQATRLAGFLAEKRNGRGHAKSSQS